MIVSKDVFLKLGNQYTESSMARSSKIALRRFKSFFGVPPFVCQIIWEKLETVLPVGAEPKHLLWSLLFLKRYSDEHTRRSIVGSDEKTIRKWTWIFVELLSNMDVVTPILLDENHKIFFFLTLHYCSQIVWENRFEMATIDQTSFVSLDGLDCKIDEQKPFSRLWYSHKFKGPGLRYEIGLNMRSGFIVWAFGGYPCGEYNDLKLARELYVLSVNVGEKTVADKGYKDKKFFIMPDQQNKKVHERIMSRHETVNKRLRQFSVLRQVFRHDIKKHPICFHAVVNITQIILENGSPLFKAL